MGGELSGLKQSAWRGEGRATGYLLEDKILFWGSWFCYCKVAQKSLHLHQVGQLVNEDICQECTELWAWKGRVSGDHDQGARAREAAQEQALCGALAEQPMRV